MQITLANPGQALIHFLSARSLIRAKYMAIVNCASCDVQRKQSLKDGVEFYDKLINELREQVDAQSEM